MVTPEIIDLDPEPAQGTTTNPIVLDTDEPEAMDVDAAPAQRETIIVDLGSSSDTTDQETEPAQGTAAGTVAIDLAADETGQKRAATRPKTVIDVLNHNGKLPLGKYMIQFTPKIAFTIEYYLQGAIFDKNSCGIDSLMKFAQAIHLGVLRCEPALASDDDSFAAQLVRYVSLPSADIEQARKFLRAGYNKLARTLDGDLGSPATVWTEEVGKKFLQTSFHLARMTFCQRCQRVCNNTRYAVRTGMIERAVAPGRSLAADMGLSDALQDFFRITKVNGRCDWCFHHDKGSAGNLQHGSFVTDRLPWHLVLGETFSPAIVDHNGEIPFDVHTSPTEERCVSYTFKAAIAFDSKKQHFTVFWKHEDSGKVLLQHYDDLSQSLKGRGVAKTVGRLPTPLHFKLLAIQTRP